MRPTIRRHALRILLIAGTVAAFAAPAAAFGGRPAAEPRTLESLTQDDVGPIVPEPTAGLLFGAGSLVVAAGLRRRRALG
jgi:hypothetical protein